MRTARAALAHSPTSTLSLEALLAHSFCVACLILQRFGLTLGSTSQLFASLLICPALLFALLVLGRARVGAAAALLFLLAGLSCLTTTFLAILYPDFNYRLSLMSLAELGILYAPFFIVPKRDFRGDIVLRVFIFWARIIAVFGTLQYAAQFIGIRLFSFSSLQVPASMSMESAFHVVAPTAYGSNIFRSNGFFLLEPSIFSQVMALACVVDALVLRRYTWLPVYGIGILASSSGTGVLILAMTLLVAGTINSRQAPVVLGLFLVGTALVGLASVFFPEQFESLRARASGSDPSAQARYVEQLNVFQTIRSDARLVLGFGPGSADGFVHLGSMSAALKLLFDYGAVGLAAVGAFLVTALWRRDHLVLTVVGLLTYQLGGGYLLFPPMVMLIALLCIWGRSPSQQQSRLRAAWARAPSNAVPAV